MIPHHFLLLEERVIGLQNKGGMEIVNEGALEESGGG